MLTELETRLRGKGLSDILLVGFAEEDEVPVRFYSLLRSMYFEYDTVVLEMATLNDTGRMRLSFVEAPRHCAELDEGMVPAITSIRQQVLRDTESKNSIAALRLWEPSYPDGAVECAAARLDLANGQQIFVDPSYHFGIVLGGREQQEIWEENWPDSAQIHVEIVLTG